jgi:RNA polymerase sigma factor (sigma-70 family)
MSDTGLTVHIVDDDPAMRDSLALLLSLRGYRTASFASAEDFLAAIRPDWVGCILADIRMPGMSGLEMQHALASRGTSMPVIVLTAHGDVESARAAFKAHAIDFLEAIEQALGREASRVTTSQARERQAQALSALTPRERDVLELVVLGQHNREVAERLGISPRTVEVHKARLMEKLGVGSLAELLRVLRPGA